MEKYFFEAFEGLIRLAPGSRESTLRAIAMLDDRERTLNILDIGCGVGSHTFILAEAFPNARITAIDNHEPYIIELNKKAAEQGLADRVVGECVSMLEMPYADESFDIIWAEGSMYIAGFENALNDWKRLLKQDGYLICNDACWITDEPSQDSVDFWLTEYPEIDTVDNKMLQIKSAGYEYKGHFITPVSDWTDHYYSPLQNNLNKMRAKYPDNKTAQEVIDMLQAEIDLYNNNSDDYSYVFFCLRT